jgi:hypothetical protein
MTMSREEIEQMPAGATMDTLIALEVMGWTRYRNSNPATSVEEQKALWEYDYVPACFNGNIDYCQPVPRYSTSLTAAWQVVEEAKKPGLYPFFLTQDRYGGTYSNGLWLASFGVRYREYEEGPLGDDTDAMDYWNQRFGEWVEDPTLPFGGYCPSSTGPAKGNIAAANTPALAICKARLLAHFCPLH